MQGAIDGNARGRGCISFPIAARGILSAGILAFTLSWNEFLYALVFLSSPQPKTIPIEVFRIDTTAVGVSGLRR